MARSRQKPSEAVAGQPETIGSAVDQVLSQAEADGTDFDPAKLEAQAPSREPGDDTEPAATTHAKRVSSGSQRAKIPDPFGAITISLTDDNDGPKARLLRSRDHNDMWLQFDEKPDPAILDQIKAEGFRWESRARDGDHKGAWVKELDPDQAWRTHADAERLLKDVANQIREKNGLDPVSVMGVQDR